MTDAAPFAQECPPALDASVDPELVARLEALIDRADDGEWSVRLYGDGDSLVIESEREWRICFMATPGASPSAMDRIEANAGLIVELKNALPMILSALRCAVTAGQGTALGDVAAERHRQMTAEGWTPEHDDSHDRDNALSRAAACYALAGMGGNGPFWINSLQVPQQVWPYRWEWKPKDRRFNLVRAAALLVAEIERVDRAALGSGGSER